MRAVLAVTLVLGACATSRMETADGPAAEVDAGVDGAPAADATTDAATDAAPDASTATPDADPGVDAPPCTIAMGHTPALDGTDDLADFPAAQRLTPGATMAATDEVAVTWDPTYLYVAVTSEAFLDGSKPLHVYVETGATLAAAAPVAGKEYGGHTAQVGFAAGYVIATRRTDDFGTGPYGGIYTPGGTPAWTERAYALEPGVHVFASSDNRTLAVRAPWSALGGCPLAMRVSVHVVNGAAGNEWKDLVPTTHAPWLTGGGGFYEMSLAGDPAISGWTLR